MDSKCWGNCCAEICLEGIFCFIGFGIELMVKLVLQATMLKKRKGSSTSSSSSSIGAMGSSMGGASSKSRGQQQQLAALPSAVVEDDNSAFEAQSCNSSSSKAHLYSTTVWFEISIRIYRRWHDSGSNIILFIVSFSILQLWSLICFNYHFSRMYSSVLISTSSPILLFFFFLSMSRCPLYFRKHLPRPFQTTITTANELWLLQKETLQTAVTHLWVCLCVSAYV